LVIGRAWLTGQIETGLVKMTPHNFRREGLYCWLFHHVVLRCNVKPQKELAPALALLPMRLKNETMGQDKMQAGQIKLNFGLTY
jgi:hypothetical protein